MSRTRIANSVEVFIERAPGNHALWRETRNSCDRFMWFELDSYDESRAQASSRWDCYLIKGARGEIFPVGRLRHYFEDAKFQNEDEKFYDSDGGREGTPHDRR